MKLSDYQDKIEKILVMHGGCMNDHITRSNIKREIIDVVSDYHYPTVVICDQTNNPPLLVDSNSIAFEVYCPATFEKIKGCFYDNI